MKTTTVVRKVFIYIFSGFSFFFYIGLIGTISRLKKPMEEELNLSSTFLGIVDGLRFIALGLGSIILLLYPSKFPKRSYIISSLLMISMFSLTALSAYIPQYAEPIILVAMTASGFFRASMLTPFLIMNQYFDSKGEDKKLVAIWSAFKALGSGFAVLFCQILLENFKLNWSTCIFIYSGIFLIPIICLQLSADQVIMEDQQDQTLSSLDKAKQFFKRYYKKPSNILHTFQFSWNVQILFSIELWIPYYFLTLGFKSNSSVIAIAYSVALFLSAPLFECLVTPFQSHIQIILMAMPVLNVFTLLAMTQLQESISYFSIYLALVILSAFFYSSLHSRVVSEQLKHRAHRGNRQMFMVLLTMSFLNSTQIGIDLALIGYVMETRLKNFLYAVLILCIIAAANQIIRQLVWGQDYDQVDKDNEDKDQLANSLRLEK